MSTLESAVLYIPATCAASRYWLECSALCQAHRWPVVAVTHDPATARRLVAFGVARRVVVARPGHARQVAIAVVVAVDPPGRPGGRDPDRPKRLR